MKKNNFRILLILCLGFGVNGLATLSLAKTKTTEAHAKKIENVLDRLEERLIDKESSPLTLEEQEKRSQKISNEPKNVQKYVPKSPTKITGKTPSASNLNELQRKINEYDTRLELLESDVRKVQSNTREAAATDNTVSLEIRIAEGSNIAIRTLSATLDGSSLYNQVDPAGLWMPTKSIPLFYGPLQPGVHTIDIDGYIAPNQGKDGSQADWRQKGIKQSLSFTLAEGVQRKTFAIEISSGNGDKSPPTAKLVDREVK